MHKGKIIGLSVAGVLTACSFFLKTDATTITATTPVPAVGEEGGPFRELNGSDLTRFINGRFVFDRDFKLSEGLGAPNLNGDSCRACHFDPIIGGSGGLDVNVFRFAHDNNGAGPFANVAGGQIASKVRRPDMPLREEYDQVASDVFEQRQTPTIFGIGMIDSIPESVITANEDPNDLNGDGISGFAHRILTANGLTVIGRFGWKAQIPTVLDFVHDGMFNELGITTIPEIRGFGTSTDSDTVADPELSQQDFDDILFFMSTLAPPPRGGNSDPGVAVGEGLFTSVGCAACHIPSLQGSLGAVPLFSDLLLHNVQAPGFRGMADGQAGVGEYRTPPLWGIRKTAPYMHDGRAETLEAAIQAHFGEATNAKNNFNALTSGQKNALLLFLSDL